MYFEAMVASEFGAGTVTVTACSVSRNVYMGTASPTDAGFVSIPILAAIPSGCRDWSVSASGGHVHVRSVDVIYPQSPTINGVLNCSSWGMNDWCTGTENLDLTAYEPQGASVIISGDLNGDPFTCLPGLTCSNPITEEGTGTANYLATSINGTGSGSIDWKLDSLSPDIDANLSGSFNGQNWSNTDVTLNASVSDATSGLSYFESSLDNATWTPQTSPLTLNFSDGTRTVYLHAVDRAGNIESIQYEIKVDTQDPQLTETFTGTSGSNPWYISDVQVTITQSDPYPSSGIQYFAYSKDGGATWTNYTTPFTLSEGVYDLQMHLVDNADNQDMKSQAIKVDTTVPSISGSLNQIPNALGWINAAVNLNASASDSTSGVASFEISLDNATWTAQSSPLMLNFSDGTYTVYLRAIDNAGHEYLLTQEIKVDSQSPALSHQVQGTLGENSWYTSDIQVEVTQVDPAPSSGIQSFQTSLDGANWADYSAPLNFSEGTYVLQMRVVDNADHQDLDGIPLNVDTTPPSIDATLSGTLGSNNIYISPVEAAVSVSDNLSGIAATEYSLNGSAWEPYTSQLTLAGGVYALQFRTKDTAGLVSTTQVYDFSVDTHGPNIKLPSRWYIWETGDLFVKDDGSGIASVSYEIRDREGRWKKVEQSWDLNQEIFTYEITWNRVFADGTLAPDGEYPVRVSATDHAGHSSQKTALIIVPPANATLLPTFTATPTQTQTPSPTPAAMETQSLATATAMPTMTSTPFVFITATLDAEPVEAPTQKSSGGFFGFGNPPQQTDTEPQSPNPLIGITAAAVTGAYIATQRKKEVEFGSAPKEAKQAPASPNVFEGAQAAALMSAFTAKMEEDRQRRIAEKALAAEEAEKQNILNYQAVQRRIQEIARAREEARRRREEAKRKAAVNPLQALWDANGAAIYAANQNFKATYGKDMDAATRKKAIKDATVNGHFSAGAYATNLNTARQAQAKKNNPYAGAADRIRAAANEIEDEKKIGYVDSERDEVRKLIALNEQKNAPVDSATASYMAMGAAAEAGKFSKEDYDKAQDDAEALKTQVDPKRLFPTGSMSKMAATGGVILIAGVVGVLAGAEIGTVLAAAAILTLVVGTAIAIGYGLAILDRNLRQKQKQEIQQIEQNAAPPSPKGPPGKGPRKPKRVIEFFIDAANGTALAIGNIAKKSPIVATVLATVAIASGTLWATLQSAKSLFTNPKHGLLDPPGYCPAPTSTSTQTPTQTPTSTSTQTPTQTPTSTPTQTPTPTPTQTPTQTPTSTPTQAPTSTPTQTPTQTSTQPPT